LSFALGVVIVVAMFSGVELVRAATAQPIIPGAGATSISVTAANGYAFDPNSFQDVATNSTISVTFTDGSELAHTFTIIGREGWVIPSTYTNDQILDLAYGHTWPNLINLNVSTSGDHSTGTFNSTGPGWYEFICTEGGHFTLGMYGFIAFGINLPSNLTVSSGLPGPGSALFIIIGAIVSLVVIALVLGFVVGRRKGSRHEMAPERLGYAEPPATGEPLPTDSGTKHPP
jgi:plastocyanin